MWLPRAVGTVEGGVTRRRAAGPCLHSARVRQRHIPSLVRVQPSGRGCRGPARPPPRSSALLAVAAASPPLTLQGEAHPEAARCLAQPGAAPVPSRGPQRPVWGGRRSGAAVGNARWLPEGALLEHQAAGPWGYTGSCGGALGGESTASGPPEGSAALLAPIQLGDFWGDGHRLPQDMPHPPQGTLVALQAALRT